MDSDINNHMDQSELKSSSSLYDLVMESNDKSKDFVKKEVQIDNKTLISEQTKKVNKLKETNEIKNKNNKNSIDVSVSKSMKHCTINYEKEVKKSDKLNCEIIDESSKTFSLDNSPMFVDNKVEINQAVKHNVNDVEIENVSLSLEKEEAFKGCATHNELDDFSIKVNNSIIENTDTTSSDDDFVEVQDKLQSTSENLSTASTSESTSDVQKTENLNAVVDNRVTDLK